MSHRRHNLDHMKLTDTEQAVLDFEAGGWWKHPGARQTAIRERFGWTDVRYAAVLNNLIDQPEATAYAPTLVARLRRLREQRRGLRSARRLEFLPHNPT